MLRCNANFNDRVGGVDMKWDLRREEVYLKVQTVAFTKHQ